MPTETLDEARERLRPYVERARRFSGWTDFPETKPLGPQKPWSYMARARQLMSSAASVLDLGTGGGERFADLLEGYGGRAVATEEWHVNAPVAKRTLAERGAEVVRCRSVHLPFGAESFDLVLSRHEELDPAEVARVLQPGGVLLTQQTWRFWDEVAAYIPRWTDFGDHFRGYQQGLVANGMKVTDAQEHVAQGAFESLGDLVYMLCVTPWHIPDFDPLRRDLDALLRLERELTTPDGLVMAEGYYLIEARKPV